MVYGKILPGVFLTRPNRFIAHVEIEGRVEVCHVKNTGRCRELLVPGVSVWLEESGRLDRKTKYDLIAVEKAVSSGSRLINMDSQAPNRIFGEWATAGGLGFVPTFLRAEMTYGNSRFDYYWELLSEDENRRGFWEVKGVTLEEHGTARFPDAPTLRGVKHLEELIQAHEAGYEAGVCFIVQMAGMDHVEPNDATHPEFGAALRRAARAGVKALALECDVEPGRLSVRGEIPVRL